MEEADDFGEFLGYDGKAMESHSTGASNRVTGKTSDPDADWGKHETHGIHAQTGKPWKKIKTWFGYRVHTIADTQTEIPVAASVTRASVSEVKELERLSERLFEETPALAERCKEFSADRGLDNGPLKATLWDRHRIRPLIDSRALWSAEKKQAGYDPAKPISRPLFRGRNDCIHHTERGEVICKRPATGTERPMVFQGFEADRSTLKYRCPAAACSFACEGRDDTATRRRLQGGRVRPGDPHRTGEAQPPHLHPDPAGQPVLAARIQSPERVGAHLQPPRQWLPVRAPHHSRQGEDDRPGRPRDGGDDGPDARPSPRWPQATNAIPGWRHTGPRHRIECPTASPPKPPGSETEPRPDSARGARGRQNGLVRRNAAELKPTLAPQRRRKAARGRCRPRQLPHERRPEQKKVATAQTPLPGRRAVARG